MKKIILKVFYSLVIVWALVAFFGTGKRAELQAYTDTTVVFNNVSGANDTARTSSAYTVRDDGLKTFQFGGVTGLGSTSSTFNNISGTLTFQGSLDGTTYSTLTDVNGNSMSYSKTQAPKIVSTKDAVKYVRAVWTRSTVAGSFPKIRVILRAGDRITN